MLRSEKVSVVFLLTICSIVVVVQVYLAVQAFTGRGDDTPAYQRQPPAQLRMEPDDTLVDPKVAQEAPIHDDDFVALRKSTRELAGALGTSRWERVAGEYADSDRVLPDLSRQQRDLSRVASASKAHRLDLLHVDRPRASSDRRDNGALTARTTVQATYTQADENGQPLPPATVTYTFFWVERDAGWRLTDSSALISGAASGLSGRAGEFEETNPDGALTDPSGLDTPD